MEIYISGNTVRTQCPHSLPDSTLSSTVWPTNNLELLFVGFVDNITKDIKTECFSSETKCSKVIYFFKCIFSINQYISYLKLFIFKDLVLTQNKCFQLSRSQKI